jgi:integrase
LENTKNGERREIPINDILKDVLRGLPRRIDNSLYLFYDPSSGKPYGNIKKSFKATCRKAHIGDFRFHDLRHTFASHLVMAGVDLASTKELLVISLSL